MNDAELLTEVRLLRDESRQLIATLAEAMDVALVLLEASEVEKAYEVLRENIEVCRSRPLGTVVN